MQPTSHSRQYTGDDQGGSDGQTADGRPTRCATAYRRGGYRTRRLFNAAVLDEVHVRDGHVVEAAYKEPFDLLFSVPKFEYDDVVGAKGLEPPTSAV